MNVSDFYSYRFIGKLTSFFTTSGVQLPQPNSGLFHFRRAAFSAKLKAKVGSTLTKVATLRINFKVKY